jgi:hypothetical protein
MDRNGATLGFERALLQAADKLRDNLDATWPTQSAVAAMSA